MQNNTFSSSHPGASRTKTLIVLLLIAITVLLLDRITKTMVVQNLALYSSWEPLPTLGRIFRITYILNSGAAFGLFQQGGNIFMIVALLVAAAIVYYVVTYPFLPGMLQLCLGLQLGGALGNMWDRMLQGAVVDFIDIGFWPIFNIADSSIVCGVILLAFWLWQEEERQKEAAPVAPPTDDLKKNSFR